MAMTHICTSCTCAKASPGVCAPVQLTPEWERLAAVIEADEGMRKELGYVARHRFHAVMPP